MIPASNRCGLHRPNVKGQRLMQIRVYGEVLGYVSVTLALASFCLLDSQ